MVYEDSQKSMVQDDNGGEGFRQSSPLNILILLLLLGANINDESRASNEVISPRKDNCSDNEIAQKIGENAKVRKKGYGDDRTGCFKKWVKGQI